MKELINYISDKQKIERKDILEKDIILHRILCRLLEKEYFSENYVFKGGTCLIKCYYGYYRFSEDLDFTWIKQDVFNGLSKKKIDKLLSSEIDKIAKIIDEISKSLRLDFKYVKTNEKYMQYGGSKRFITFKLWYNSVFSGQENFIKIQINYNELFIYPIKELEAKAIVSEIYEKEIKFLFPESEDLLYFPKIRCYHIKEILLEKIRAILTRRGVKARDFVDVFKITKKEKIDITTLNAKIIQKVNFMLKYDKYIQNLKNYKIEKLVLGEEEKLMLVPLESGFKKFLEEFYDYLNVLSKELVN